MHRQPLGQVLPVPRRAARSPPPRHRRAEHLAPPIEPEGPAHRLTDPRHGAVFSMRKNAQRKRRPFGRLSAVFDFLIERMTRNYIKPGVPYNPSFDGRFARPCGQRVPAFAATDLGLIMRRSDMIDTP